MSAPVSQPSLLDTLQQTDCTRPKRETVQLPLLQRNLHAEGRDQAAPCPMPPNHS